MDLLVVFWYQTPHYYYDYCCYYLILFFIFNANCIKFPKSVTCKNQSKYENLLMEIPEKRGLQKENLNKFEMYKVSAMMMFLESNLLAIKIRWIFHYTWKIHDVRFYKGKKIWNNWPYFYWIFKYYVCKYVYVCMSD